MRDNRTSGGFETTDLSHRTQRVNKSMSMSVTRDFYFLTPPGLPIGPLGGLKLFLDIGKLH